MIIIAWLSLSLGALIACVNFYLSFLRYPIYRLLGRSQDQYRFVSGYPIAGTVLVVLAWLLLPADDWN